MSIHNVQEGDPTWHKNAIDCTCLRSSSGEIVSVNPHCNMIERLRDSGEWPKEVMTDDPAPDVEPVDPPVQPDETPVIPE